MKSDEFLDDIVRKLDSFDHYEIFAMNRKHGLTRFANNVIHQHVFSETDTISIRAAIGKKIASISGGIYNYDNLINYLKRAVKVAPERDYFQGFAMPGDYQSIGIYGYAMDTNQRVDMVDQIIENGLMYDVDVRLFGKIETYNLQYSVINNNGINAKHKMHFNDVKVMSIKEENGKRGYGRQVATFNDPDDFNLEVMAETAVTISQDTLHAKSIEPGEYSVILRPQAGAELINYALMGLNSNSYHQKDSAYSDKIGEQLLSENLIIEDRPLDSNSVMATPFDAEGVATKNVKIIDHGVPKQVFYNTLEASQFLGDKSLSSAHAVIPYNDYLWTGSGPMNLSIPAGDSSEFEMIEDMKKGLLIQTFWYSNAVNMPKGIITGLTRDGLYLVENGEIKTAVKNMRYTDSFLSFFNELSQISKNKTSLINEFGLASSIPIYKLDKLKFTGKSRH